MITQFDVTVEGDFIFDNAAADFNLNGGSLVVSGNVFITADDFSNYATIDVANDFNATVRDFINHGPINVANDLNVTASDFANHFQINVGNNLNATASNAFQNRRDIIADNLTIETSQFNNINGNNIGYITVDTLDLTLSSSSLFDYEDDYLNNGTISTTNLILEVTLLLLKFLSTVTLKSLVTFITPLLVKLFADITRSPANSMVAEFVKSFTKSRIRLVVLIFPLFR